MNSLTQATNRYHGDIANENKEVNPSAAEIPKTKGSDHAIVKVLRGAVEASVSQRDRDESPKDVASFFNTSDSRSISPQDDSPLSEGSFELVDLSNRDRITIPNHVDYSKEEFIIEDDEGNEFTIPKDGSFKAGSKLLYEVGEEIFEMMVSDVTEKREVKILELLKLDIKRSTDFVISNKREQLSIKPSKTSAVHSIDDSLEKLSEFLEVENDSFISAILTVANQTLGNVCNLFCAGAGRPSLKMSAHEGAARGEVPFSSEGAIGFPNPSHTKIDSSTPSLLFYNLQKVEDPEKATHYILHFTNIAKANAFFLKNDREERPDLIMLDEGIEQEIHSSISLKITRNPDFEATEITKTNFPCSVECIHFLISYSTLDSDIESAEYGEMAGNSA